MEHLEGRERGLKMVKPREMNIDPKIRNAVTLYANEGIQWYRESLATPVDGEGPPEAPRS
jgi:hypothetical protein